MYEIDFKKPCHVHFIGIGGISMSGLAEILMDEGFQVSGSDAKESELTRHLEAKGAKVFYGQRPSNVGDEVDLAVYTAAVHPDNPEYGEVVRRGIPMLSRAELLGQMMKNYRCSLGVSGTHGKTTTTSMITEILLAAGKDPTISVGGILHSIGGNIRVGGPDLFVTEACEYTNSFLHFLPTDSVILNIEEDHMDFFKDLADIRRSFRQFAQNTAAGGRLVISADIPGWEEIAGIEGFGEIMARSVEDYFREEHNRKLCGELAGLGLNTEEARTEAAGELSGLTFVLTGTLPTMTRGEAAALIEAHGGKTASSVSKKTSYVLAGEEAGSKLTKANQLGIPVLSEEDLRKMIKGGTEG